jgi:hypothetical protein
MQVNMDGRWLRMNWEWEIGARLLAFPPIRCESRVAFLPAVGHGIRFERERTIEVAPYILIPYIESLRNFAQSVSRDRGIRAEDLSPDAAFPGVPNVTHTSIIEFTSCIDSQRSIHVNSIAADGR